MTSGGIASDTWILNISMGAMNRLGTRLSYRPARVENLSPAMGRGIDSRNQVWNWVAKLHRLAGRYDNPMEEALFSLLFYWRTLPTSVWFTGGFIIWQFACVYPWKHPYRSKIFRYRILGCLHTVFRLAALLIFSRQSVKRWIVVISLVFHGWHSFKF